MISKIVNDDHILNFSILHHFFKNLFKEILEFGHGCFCISTTNVVAINQSSLDGIIFIHMLKAYSFTDRRFIMNSFATISIPTSSNFVKERTIHLIHFCAVDLCEPVSHILKFYNRLDEKTDCDNIIIMSNVTCLQKICQCLFFKTNKRQESLNKIKNYQNIDTSLSTSYISPTQQQVQTHLKYQDKSNIEIVELPHAQHDLYSGESSVLINQCKQSIFFILRPSASAYIDSCQNCHIFLGPSNGTVFIRNCKNIKIITISQQLRIQNSEVIHIQGIVSSRPVLEYCKNIKFSSMNCELYDGVLWQMQKFNINMFENKIYETHDFTPKKNNYENLNRNSQELQQFNEIWGNIIQKNKIQCKPMRLFFPCFVALKSSLVKKKFSEKQIKSKQDIFLLCCKLPFKILLQMLSSESMKNKLQIISQIDPQAGFRSLKITHKNSLLKIDTHEGRWYFLLVNTKEKKTMEQSLYNVFIVEDKQLIWNLFSQL